MTVSRTSKYLAFLGAAAATLAIGCAEPTAPNHAGMCSGGGTQGWDICGTPPHDSGTTSSVKAMAAPGALTVKKP